MEIALRLAYRVNEVVRKTRTKGLTWAIKRVQTKVRGKYHIFLDESLAFLRDLRYRGFRRAIANLYIELKFRYNTELVYNYASPRIKPDFPLHVQIETAADCNIFCPMCARWDMGRKSGVMKLDLYKKIIDELALRNSPRVIHLHFSGEPLMNPDLPEMIKYAKGKGVSWIKFNTNAVLLDEKMGRQILESGLDCIVCALEVTKEQQKKFRPGADYDLVVSNVKRFMELKKKLGYLRPVVKLQMLTTKFYSTEVIQHGFNFWKNIVDRVDFHGIHTIGGLVPDFGTARPRWDHCEQLWSKLVFLWNGEVAPCCNDFKGALKLGNVTEQSIESIWNSPFLESLREDDKARNYTNPTCHKCMLQGVPN